MKLEPPYLIDDRKLTHYLLVYLSKDDKSNYLGLAGYTLTNWQVLKQDLLTLAKVGEAVIERSDGYGIYFSVTGRLRGTNNRSISVKAIWMRDTDDEITKFITLYPPN